jgi:YidC/Oxa1 family membrane protein insertase
MQRKDIFIVAFLVVLMILLQPLDRHFIKPLFFPEPPPGEVVDPATPREETPRPLEQESPADVSVADPVLQEREPSVMGAIPDPVDENAQTEGVTRAPEEFVTLENKHIRIAFSTHGATVKEATMLNYDAENKEGSESVHLDFGAFKGLELEGLSGLTTSHDFEARPLPQENSVVFQRDLPYGVRFERRYTLTGNYVLSVRDTFRNISEQALVLPAYGVRLGPMKPLENITRTYGLFDLSVDALMPGGESVQRFGKDITKRLKNATVGTTRIPLNSPVDWIAVKNKYFVQSLMPRDLATENATIFVTRGEDGPEPQEMWATLLFPETPLSVSGFFERDMTYYIGPKKYEELSTLGFHQDQIMELGWWIIRYFAVGLMWGMNAIYAVVGNYGLAIMLLVIFIRIVFWPLTHKGTESMRRMQELAPLMKELNEKYKDDAQKRQQALMELYKEHKVNPLGGCMPMLVQIPVFIGLFYVLRSAIELRYAGFLWIDDLSEPEGLLGDVLPLPLNILPLLMAATMFLQQKLTPTPSAADPRQQQMHQMMMKVMPVMMLVMLYNFASGLALYWTTQNVLMIVQQALYRKRLERRKAAEAQSGGATTPASKPAAHPGPAKSKAGKSKKNRR